MSGFDGEKDDTELYYSLTNYTRPPRSTNTTLPAASTLYKAPAVNFDPSLFTTEQVFYTRRTARRFRCSSPAAI
ncbi:MAG: hypothetical protein ACLU5I_07100 [Alistipes finegoldii]